MAALYDDIREEKQHHDIMHRLAVETGIEEMWLPEGRKNSSRAGEVERARLPHKGPELGHCAPDILQSLLSRVFLCRYLLCILYLIHWISTDFKGIRRFSRHPARCLPISQ